MSPAPNRNQWVEWKEAVQNRRAALATALAEWTEAVRKEPVLIWQTTAVRYAAYGVGGLLIIMLIRAGVAMLQPPAPINAKARATTANFDVICANPACHRQFVIERKFRFDDFPVQCPFCGQPSGRQALRCPSAHCMGKRVSTEEQDGVIRCAECGAELGRR